jgi:hypothetical protein
MSDAVNFYAELSAVDNKFTPTFEKGRNKWVPWGHKGDDRYPTMLLELIKNSSLHGMILKSKTNQVIGQGFDVADDKDVMPQEQKDFLENADGRDNSLKANSWESGQDLEFFGGGAFFVTWDSTWSRVQYMKHVSAMKLRSLAQLNEYGEVVGYLHSEDWTKRQDKNRLLFPVFDSTEAANNKKAYAKALKDLDLEGLVKLDSKSRTQIIFDGYYLPDSVYYPVPFYSAATMVIKTDIESDRFAFNSLEGKLAAQYIIEIDGITDPILQNQAAKLLLARHTGAIASGKPLVTFTNSEGKGSVRIIPIDASGASKILTEVNIKTQQKILSAHGVTSPTLVGIAPVGGLGNSSDLDSLSDLFQANIIKPDQDKLVGMINKIMRVNKWPLLKLVPQMNVFAEQKEDGEEIIEDVPKENKA